MVKLGKQSTKGHDNLKIKMMYVVMLKGKIVLGMMAKNQEKKVKKSDMAVKEMLWIFFQLIANY